MWKGLKVEVLEVPKGLLGSGTERAREVTETELMCGERVEAERLLKGYICGFSREDIGRCG